MNKVFLSGNLTKTPEVKHTNSDKIFVRVGLAVKRQFSKDKDAVDFFNLVAWEKTAEFMTKYFSKGSRVLIEGRLQTSSYENKNGDKVTSVDVLIEQIEFADSKKKTAADDLGGTPVDDEDTPF